MGTRISLGKGFTAGRSGLRYGHSVPGVPRGWISVGRSGTLLTGGPLRHWEPNHRGASPLATAERRTRRRAVLTAILIVTAVWGMFAAIGWADRDYAAANSTRGQLRSVGIDPDAVVDCATDPLAPYLYACTATPAIPAPYRGR
jgi:hypothetical protein